MSNTSRQGSMCYEELISETKWMLNYTREGLAIAGIERKKK